MGRKERTRGLILQAAGELFYANGINVSGLDEVGQRAGVTKPTLYAHFGSKEGLILGVLREWDQDRRQRISAALDRPDLQPRQRILALFDWLSGWLQQQSFRGCGLINARAELVGWDEAADLVTSHKHWVRDRLAELLHESKHPDAQQVAEALLLLMEGATALAALREDRAAVGGYARAAALRLLEPCDGEPSASG